MGRSRADRKRIKRLSDQVPKGKTMQDYRTESEGKAIDRMRIIGPVQQPRLNKTYQDGTGGLSGLHGTGKKHRKIG